MLKSVSFLPGSSSAFILSPDGIITVSGISRTLSAADSVRDVPETVIIPSGLRIKADEEPGKNETLFNMVVP